MSEGSGLSYATPPMASSPLVPGPSEDKENHPLVEVIDLTGDSEDEEEVLDLAEDSGRLCQEHGFFTLFKPLTSLV